MAAGKRGDNPLTDMIVYAMHPFPPDVEDLLRRIHELGSRQGRWPLGENWPFSAREFDWERGNDLDGAHSDPSHLLSMMQAGRGDEVLVDPLTQRPWRE
jgi:hypothetical protein